MQNDACENSFIKPHVTRLNAVHLVEEAVTSFNERKSIKIWILIQFTRTYTDFIPKLMLMLVVRVCVYIYIYINI